MIETIATLNGYAEEFDITEVTPHRISVLPCQLNSCLFSQVL